MTDLTPDLNPMIGPSAIDLLVARVPEVGAEPALLPPEPRLRAAVVTCMDARIDLSALFRLRPGEAHVIRNAGGIVTDDVVRSLAISQRRLGTREVLVLQHTGCGMMTFTDDEFRGELERDTGLRPPWAVESFVDLKDNVRQSIERIRRSPYLTATEVVRGFVLDIDSQQIDEVRC